VGREPQPDDDLLEAVQEAKSKGFEDHGSCVPPARIEEVGQNADRRRARTAEEALDRDDHFGRRDAEDLPVVRPVADDPESPRARTPSKLAATRAGFGSKCLDRRAMPEKIDELGDARRESA
jgi:hypothetical protein